MCSVHDHECVQLVLGDVGSQLHGVHVREGGQDGTGLLLSVTVVGVGLCVRVRVCVCVCVCVCAYVCVLLLGNPNFNVSCL